MFSNLCTHKVQIFIEMLSRKAEGIDPMTPWQPPDLFGEGATFYLVHTGIDNDKTIFSLKKIVHSFLNNIFLIKYANRRILTFGLIFY